MIFKERSDACDHMDKFGLKGLYVRDTVLYKQDEGGPYMDFEFYLSPHSPVCHCGACPVWKPGDEEEVRP